MTLSNQIEISLPTTHLFLANFHSKARVKINQGGTSSGKTYSILEVLFVRLIEKKKLATVVGQDIPNLKRGALRDLTDRILPANPWMKAAITKYNAGERIFYFRNGSVLEFVGYEDEQDAKNGKRDIAFFNEANGVTWAIYQQVAMRTADEIFIDYNPNAEFWVHEHLIGKPEVETFYSNFTHNPYCPDDIKQYLWALRDRDRQAWRVYGCGMTGAILDLCFPRVTVVPEMPKHLSKRGYGMDFGYRNSPSTLIECGLANGNEIYLNEIFYTVGMSPDEMAQEMRTAGIKRGVQVWADPADFRAVEYLRKEFTLPEFTKKADSVRFGISLLNQYDLFITENSLNLLKEQKQYRFKRVARGEKEGQLDEAPIDAYNHAWDAIRYWAINSLENPRSRRVAPGWRSGMA